MIFIFYLFFLISSNFIPSKPNKITFFENKRDCCSVIGTILQ